MIEPLEKYYARYESASKDPELLETFWSVWGDGKEKACRNMRAYDKYQECGYTDEPFFDEYGWLKNDVPKDKVEVVRLYGKEPLVSVVECCQLPNGKWVSGSSWFLSLSGGAGRCSIWSKQYNSRVDALTSEMNHILRRINQSERQVDKVHAEEVVRAMVNLRQLSLFDE